MSQTETQCPEKGFLKFQTTLLHASFHVLFVLLVLRELSQLPRASGGHQERPVARPPDQGGLRARPQAAVRVRKVQGDLHQGVHR